MKEVIINIGEIKDGDKVFCPDGEWRDIEILHVHKPKNCYKIHFNIGYVICSGDHLWTFFDFLKHPFTITTDIAYKENMINFNCGVEDGPKIIKFEKIDPVPCRCISIKGYNDSLFEIFLNVEEDIKNKKFEIIRD